MSENKRYYWLKLNENFFEDDTIAWLEEQKNGKDYVIFYLKLCLKSLKDDGSLIRYVGQTLIPYDVPALAKLTNTNEDTVAVAMKTFAEIGLVDLKETGEIYMTQINEMIGSETRQAHLMRRKRAKINKVKEQAKLAESHIPFIEEHTNNKRYGGNYYYVFNRDNQKCVSCGSQQNLCVHHIIGFDETDEETTKTSSMVTLCRSCHSKEHANPMTIVDDAILKSIGFKFELKERINDLLDTHGRSNNVTESYSDVNNSYTEKELEIDIEIEKDKDKEKDIDKDKEKKDAPPASKKNQKHKYGANNNVLLTDEEHKKLADKFGDTLNSRIDDLSFYIGSTGKKYKSHYLTILSWARKDEEKEQPKQKASSMPYADEYLKQFDWWEG